MTQIQRLQNEVRVTFQEMFGRTSLSARQKDILGEAMEVSRFTDIKNLRSELGQLLCSVLTGIDECGWDAEKLINETLELIRSREAQYKTLSRKTKIAILGGAFNPITKGHIQLAQFVLDTSSTFDEVWLMPCYKHMTGKDMVPAKDRLKMCNLAAQVDGRIRVFDYEIDNKFSGETFHFMNRLIDDKAYDTYNFSMIIGQDNANTFDKWVNYAELEKLLRFVVVGRQGVDVYLNVNWYLKEPHIYLAHDKEIMQVSSTMVRDLIWDPMTRHRMEEYLCSEVTEYILENKFYRPKT